MKWTDVIYKYITDEAVIEGEGTRITSNIMIYQLLLNMGQSVNPWGVLMI